MRPGTEFQTVPAHPSTVHRLYQIIDLDLILPARGMQAFCPARKFGAAEALTSRSIIGFTTQLT